MGVGGGQAGDGPHVVEEGEVVDDQDVGLRDDVGGERGGVLRETCASSPDVPQQGQHRRGDPFGMLPLIGWSIDRDL